MTVVPREPFSVYRKKQEHSSCGCHTHRSCFFLIPVPANIYIAHIFFGAKCFHFGLLWCAEMINRLMTLRLPEENKNYRPEDTGNVTHHSVLLGDKLHTFSYAPTNIWQCFKALHKASRVNTWYVCFLGFFNEQSSNLSPSLNPFCL